MQYIYFSIPDFWGHFKLNQSLIKYYGINRQYFYDNIILDSIYGSFPCIWNGGRPIVPLELLENNFLATLQPFVENNLAIRYTFTNCMLKKEHLNNQTALKILDWTDKYIPKKEVTINSPLLIDFFKKYHPDYKIIYSTTLGRLDIQTINNITKTNLLVLDYSYNNDFEFLNQLKYKNNIEILATEICVPNCPFRKQHYIEHSLKQLDYTRTLYECKNDKKNNSFNFNNWYNGEKIVKYDNIMKNYLPLGIDKFKISGRGEEDIQLLEKYIFWLVKPEYQVTLRDYILLDLYK